MIAVILAVVLTLISALPVYCQSLRPALKEGVHPRVHGMLSRLERETLTKGPFRGDMFARQRGIRTAGQDDVTVFLYADPGLSAESIDTAGLRLHGAEVIKSSGNVMKARVPAGKITAIAETVRGVSFVGLPDSQYTEAISSEGVGLTGADGYRATGSDGAGVKVCVIDVGFSGLAAAIQAGEIPNRIFAYDCSGTACSSRVPQEIVADTTRHGTAVAEIISDVAPGADLYLIKTDDSIDLIDAKDLCISQGGRIVNHSASFRNVNFLGGECYNRNPVCTVDDAFSRGVLWVNAAGNYGQSHYAAVFSDTDGDGLHNVTNESNCIGFFAEAFTEVDVFVAWDGWPVTDQDYDLYLLDSSGNAVDASVGIQTGIQPPTEELFSIVPRTGFYCIAIDKYSANRNHSFMVVTPGIDLSPNVPQTSLGSPADARGALSVGALSVSAWTTGPVAGYSSQGPTRDGRLKPEIVAPTSVSTFSFGFEPFAGTSSSAPHVAGAAALILSRNPGYTAAQLREALLASALDMDLPGQDNVSGYGRLNLQPVLPVPLGQKRLPYAPAVQPVNNTVPEQAKPLSVGAVAQAGATLSLRISFLPFTGAVDIYVALFAPAVSPDLFLIHPDLLPRPASQGVVPWRAGTRGPVNESLYGDIAVRSLPPGRYEVLVAVTPAGKTDSYVLWDTFFDVPR